jgi:DNA repair exonuclease SbcCD ATPase subunit
MTQTGSIQEVRAQLNERLAELSVACTMLRDEKARRRRLREELEALQGALSACQQLAQEVERQAHAQIATIVSRALQAVFDEPYEFKVQFQSKRGRTEASLTFVRNGQEIDPMTSSGGGVVDVAAFALRLSCLLLARPRLQKLMVLDEPWKFLSNEYRPRLRELVERLSKELGVQFIIVTHDPVFEMGAIVRI